MITRDTTVSRNPDVMSSELDGETVMMDAGYEHYFGLQTVGTRIWQLLESNTTPAEICSVLLREFDVEEAQCEEEVMQFLSELEGKGLLIFPG